MRLPLHTRFMRTRKGRQRLYFFSRPTPHGIDDDPHLAGVQRRQVQIAK
jgi:hypothetical protein